MRAHMDLCSGIGGFAIAARRAGLKTIQFVEIEPFCQAVLRKNFDGVPVHGDLRTFDARPFRGGVYLLTAGFPCQDISAAGKGAGLTGKKSSLWWQVRRVVRECRPVFCLIENVPMLLHRGIDTVISGLERAGYTCAAFVVGACDVGAPHQRKRVWIVAYRRDTVGVGHADGARCCRQNDAVCAGRDAAICSCDGMVYSSSHEFKGDTPGVRGANSGRQVDGHEDGQACSVIDRSGCEELADATARGVRRGRRRKSPIGEQCGTELADPDRAGQREHCGCVSGGQFLPTSECRCADVADASRFSTGEQNHEADACTGVGNSRGISQRGSLPAFPPARNDWDGWAVIAEHLPELLPATEPEVCNLADGVSARLVRRRRSARNATLKALGNAIVPEVAYQFIKAILECEHVIGTSA
jgi:hypothetical protein